MRCLRSFGVLKNFELSEYDRGDERTELTLIVDMSFIFVHDWWNIIVSTLKLQHLKERHQLQETDDSPPLNQEVDSASYVYASIQL